MTQPDVASLLRGGVKLGVAGRSLRGLQVEATCFLSLGSRGTPFVLGSPPMSAVGGTLERESLLGRHLCVGDRWGTLGGKEGKSFNSGSCLSFFFTLTK